MKTFPLTVQVVCTSLPSTLTLQLTRMIIALDCHLPRGNHGYYRVVCVCVPSQHVPDLLRHPLSGVGVPTWHPPLRWVAQRFR